MVKSVNEFGFLIALFFTCAFLIVAILGLVFLIGGKTADKLRKSFRPSDEMLTNASLTCEHGHEVRVYINIPGVIKGKRYNPHTDDEFWVSPKRCPVCGGRWLMPERPRGPD